MIPKIEGGKVNETLSQTGVFVLLFYNQIAQNLFVLVRTVRFLKKNTVNKFLQFH